MLFPTIWLNFHSIVFLFTPVFLATLFEVMISGYWEEGKKRKKNEQEGGGGGGGEFKKTKKKEKMNKRKLREKEVKKLEGRGKGYPGGWVEP